MVQVNPLFRKANQDDLNFIMSSWLKSYRTSTVAKEMKTDAYYRIHNKAILHNLPKFSVLIACDQYADSEIYGYIVSSRMIGDITLVHYVYVKHQFRGNDIATQLLQLAMDDTSNVIITHCSRDGESFMKSTGLTYYYAPQLFYVPELFE
jgi:GNAT superfamily N-acetyltransferase